MTEDEQARRTVARIQRQVGEAEAMGLLKIAIVLSPWYYEQCLILKGLPHGLGVLGAWGPQMQARPISEWRGKAGVYRLQFQTHGLSKITGLDGDVRKEIGIVGS